MNRLLNYLERVCRSRGFDWRFPAVFLFFVLAYCWLAPLDRYVWNDSEEWDWLQASSSFVADVLVLILLLASELNRSEPGARDLNEAER
jgi:hypothetical protein